MNTPRPFGLAITCLIGWLVVSAPARAESSITGALTEPVDETLSTLITVTSTTRTTIAPNVAHYVIDIAVGPEPQDAIRVHRVVWELIPYLPAPTEDAVMMVHGDAWDFEASFLSSLSSNAVANHYALPIYLARNGVDVWGIDFRWTLVGPETTDLAFMQRWGMGTDVSDLRVALDYAVEQKVLANLLLIGGTPKMHLLAWSRGGQTAYAYLGEESQRPAWERRIKGFIPVDIYLKTDDPSLREAACVRAATAEARLAAGDFADGTGTLLATLGYLAETLPDTPSPIVPGAPNALAAVFAGALTFQLFPAGTAPVPTYHLTGGTFSPEGMPTGLAYMSEDAWADYLAGASPWEPVRLLADSDTLVCDETDVAFDDHLDDIVVPVLYVGAAGGFGESGLYTTSLLGSEDVSSVIGSVLPPEAAVADLGHVDIFASTGARTLFWKPILQWIQSH